MSTNEPEGAPEKTLLELRPSKSQQNVDDLYNHLGDPGRLQVFIFFMLSLNVLISGVNNVSGVLLAYSPDHICGRPLDPPASHSDYGGVPDSFNLSISASVEPRNSPWVYQNVTRKACDVIVDNVTYACRRGQWEYDVSGRESSTVTEFDLVCEHEHLNHLASTFYYVGVVLGGLVSGFISDRFGRKRVTLINLYLLAVNVLGVAFAPGIVLFIVLRFFGGLFTQGVQTAAYVLNVETFPLHHRCTAGTFIQVFWGLGVIYLAGVSWCLQDWRHIQLAILGPIVVSMIAICYIPESLRWLLARGKIHQGHEVIKKIVKVNRLPDPLKDESTALQDYKVHYEKGKSSFLDLVRTPVMRKRTVLASYILLAANMGYYAMTLGTSHLAGNRYLNLLMAGVTETAVYIVCCMFTRRFGRKPCLITCFLVGAVCCLIAGVIPREEGSGMKVTGDYAITITVFAVLGRMAMAALFVIGDMYCAELFPTVVRNMALGVCTFWGRIGAALSPMILSLGSLTFPQFPSLILAAVTMIAGIISIFLPETHGTHLPDTVEDVETGFSWSAATNNKIPVANGDSLENQLQDESIQMEKLPAEKTCAEKDVKDSEKEKLIEQLEDEGKAALRGNC